jgi:hypothetical protein
MRLTLQTRYSKFAYIVLLLIFAPEIAKGYELVPIHSLAAKPECRNGAYLRGCSTSAVAQNLPH